MSTYQEFAAEREKIDFLIEQGYCIKGVTENLSGAFVEFEYYGKDSNKGETEVLHILHADTRKYFSSLIIKQQKQAL
jgi:hypothetical protein